VDLLDVRHVQSDMLYTDDPIIAEVSPAKTQERFTEWQEALESKGLKVNAEKTKTVQLLKSLLEGEIKL